MLKVGIIGCGRIMEMHANAISRLKEAKIVAVCDIVVRLAIDAANKYGGEVYTNYQELLDNEQLDVVHLCLPHYQHSIVGAYAAKKGVHVLTEKPLDISYERAKYLVDTCEKYQVKLGVIFQNRFRETNMQMYKMIKSQDFGKILGARMNLTWHRSEAYYQSTKWKGFWDKEGGGVLIDQAIHTLDFINWILGGNIKDIKASIDNRFHPSIEVEDVAEGIITYDEGYQFSFYACNYYSYDSEVLAEVQTEKAIFQMIGSQLNIISNNGEVVSKNIDLDDVREHEHRKKKYWGTTHFDQIKEFYDYVLNKRSSILVDGHEGLKTQLLVEKIYRVSDHSLRAK